MDERLAISRLHRRIGLGAPSGGLSAATQRGLNVELQRLLDPAAAGLVAPADPFEGLDLSYDPGNGGTKRNAAAAIDAWLRRLTTTDYVVADRMAWFWHGHLVSALGKVKAPNAMAEQIRLFWRHGTGDLPTLLRAVSTDPAMLVYLDGKDSTGRTPNENFSRELMELFTLGVGHYTEADIQAGARALTGWTVNLRDGGAAEFRPGRHDASPQTYLGATGVRDLDGVLAAILARPECAAFIAGTLARDTIGPNVGPAIVQQLADRFRASGYSIAALIRSVAEQLASGVDGGPIVLAPVPWLVAAQRATGAKLAAQARMAMLRASGQVPLSPPNVGGWPEGRAWYGSATVVARLNLAAAVAAATAANHPTRVGAAAGDWAGLADALGLASGFGPTTVKGLGQMPGGIERLTLALVSPEFVEA